MTLTKEYKEQGNKIDKIRVRSKWSMNFPKNSREEEKREWAIDESQKTVYLLGKVNEMKDGELWRKQMKSLNTTCFKMALNNEEFYF